MNANADHSRRRMVREWLRRAAMDIETSETLLSGERALYHPACFHCQQAAEKYLKAFLTWHQVEFPMTHSIRELLNLVQSVDRPLAQALTAAAALTVYAVESRYPSDVPDPSRADVVAALDLARTVRGRVLPALPSDDAQ